MANFFKNFIDKNGFQPILTIILILVVIGFGFAFFFQNNSNSNLVQEVEVTRRITFDEAANRFLNEDFEVLTRGNLYVKDLSTQTVDPKTQTQSTPSPSVTQISLIENKYEDVFFLSSKSQIKKVDAKTFGINGSIFFNSKGELVFLDNVNKQYTIYKIPDDSEKKVVELFKGVDLTFKENLFPLTPLIQDYKEKKFNPIENTKVQNLYSGRWQHPVYTNNEVSTVAIQTDPNTGLFSAMFIASSNPPSQLYFDFRKVESLEGFDTIPEDYKSVPPVTEYKVKQ